MKLIFISFIILCVPIAVMGQTVDPYYGILKALEIDCSKSVNAEAEYCAGKGLSLELLAESTHQSIYYFVEDKGTLFSGAHTKRKWILHYDRIKNSYKIIQTLPYELQLLKTKTEGFNDIEIYYNYYSEYVFPSREMRTGVLKWNNGRYVFDRIIAVNNKRFDISFDVLDQMGYCTQEAEQLGKDHAVLKSDIVELRNMTALNKKIAPDTEGLIIYQDIPNDRFDTWIFEKQKNKYILCRKFSKQKVTLAGVMANGYYMLQIETSENPKTGLPVYKRIDGKYVLIENNSLIKLDYY